MVKELLQAGANVSSLSGDEESPLALASKHGHDDVAVSLLDAGVRNASCLQHAQYDHWR